MEAPGNFTFWLLKIILKSRENKIFFSLHTDEASRSRELQFAITKKEPSSNVLGRLHLWGFKATLFMIMEAPLVIKSHWLVTVILFELRADDA